MYGHFWIRFIVVVILVCVQCRKPLESPIIEEYEKGIHKIVTEFLSAKVNKDDNTHHDNNNSNNNNNINNNTTTTTSDSGSLFTKFPCPRLPPSPHPPRSVHELTPADVDVVAAIGDSLTAGKAAGSRGMAAVLFDYRGLSWSIGGDGTFDTLHSLPNILREYNPDLYGFSNSIGNLMSKMARLNVAKSGATSDDIAFQAALLIQRLKNDPNVDFENGWKIVTILIGANDLCRSCKSPAYTPLRYIQRLKSALDILHDSVPRLFVNLVEVMPVELSRYLPRDSFCQRIETYYCQCAVNPKSEDHYQQLISDRKEFQRLTEDLVASGRYDDKDDFTVVLQPLYKNFTIQMIPGTHQIDYSIFAVDCFHLSTKGQSRGGLGLWNNMLQPVGQKSIDWGITESILCPTDVHPFLATARNSKHHHRYGKRKIKGLIQHSWLKKVVATSIKELKHHGIHIESNQGSSSHANKERNENKPSDTGSERPADVGNKDDDDDSRGGNEDGTKNKSSSISKEISNGNNNTDNKNNNNDNKNNNNDNKNNNNDSSSLSPDSNDDVIVEVLMEEPEAWKIWSLVMGWTLFMSTVLVYCVSLKRARAKKTPIPPKVFVQTNTPTNIKH